MSDQTLRGLARRARETGDLADRRAWLQARLRVGELTSRGLRLLAYVGDPAAAEVWGGDPDAIDDLLEDGALVFGPDDPQGELEVALTPTLARLRADLPRIQAELEAAGHICPGWGPYARKVLERGLAEVRAAGFYVPRVLERFHREVGIVMFVDWGTLQALAAGQPVDPARLARLAREPLDLTASWVAEHDVWNEDRVAGEPYRLTIGPSSANKRGLPGGALHVMAGPAPCLDARLLDDDGQRETLLQHLRRAVAGGGFLVR